MWKKYHIYLHIPTLDFENKTKKNVFPSEFPLDGVIYIETVVAAASNGAWFAFATVNQGLKLKCNQASAGGLEWVLIP